MFLAEGFATRSKPSELCDNVVSCMDHATVRQQGVTSLRTCDQESSDVAAALSPQVRVQAGLRAERAVQVALDRAYMGPGWEELGRPDTRRTGEAPSSAFAFRRVQGGRRKFFPLSAAVRPVPAPSFRNLPFRTKSKQ